MSKQNAEQIPWDDAFKQLMRETLSTLGLEVIEDPKLGKLPLKADLVIISPQDRQGEWKTHPLWKHLSDQNLLEFKSIADPLKPGDFEVLLAYTLLYRVKFKIGYSDHLSSWLVLPSLTPTLKQALNHYQIKLQEILPGFWQAQTLFPLFVLAYNNLPAELPYSQLKLFIKSGKALQEIFKHVLESEQRADWLEAMLTIMELVHPQDTEEVLLQMGLAAERQSLRQTMLELVKDEVEERLQQTRQESRQQGRQEGRQEGQLEGKRETARQMKADGMPLANICRYTGLSPEEVAGL
ncbi:hypothetical protein COW36_18555 [bacterium (Candidatus Blackallbacteria) CG17_big_fil_post_rev_8_21_14_2_50_48_46]|uniref:Transposase (putative) YhgA-like domain-containing protein n=1 Tax=bacterium (Candidatus Blackallbacteria) CG17_big_fil_post_rev_8_21_14_2_50_48_46 TaxID=2014261 RepID=A0A2M7G189_9BACT|nr:MAG: hypothetical protein COW64_00180 [bacterium (Candidatus Blackallbacteria) CG18_big_fil_WC_8_21_14_2_50_49_26]PIW15416.1 MAG: hypothetical protein COW36_18555 [bacterium (Candidatus Blackallbacteria) CG17_big_fil_post_rev_8_21_14_2_50_48_46]PIW49723.1 MAG: hypothetical protein COW20_04810 [bacterium (Candidatus Blackallbacteria) CG13_big_fil_rev_8_21_14_2_50_49_14]